MKKLRIDAIFFIAVISLLGAANFLNINKPTVSTLENRALKQKPQFTFEGLFDGSYLMGFEDHYSDTFILRDDLVRANRDIRHAMEFLGPDVTIITAYDDIQLPAESGANGHDGDVNVGDNSSKTGTGSEEGTGEGSNVDSSTQNARKGSGINGAAGSSADGNKRADGMLDTAGDSASGVGSSGTGNGPGEAPEGSGNGNEAGDAAGETRDFGDGPDVGYWMVVDGKAVQLFKFNKESFEYYADVLNKYNEKMGSGVKIYSMIPPTNSEFVKLRKYQGITDSQNDALAFLKSRLDDRITSVNVYDALNAHTDEYIYFRTDHHWTALGAFYAYEEFMRAKGSRPLPLDRYEKLELGDFLGSSYSKTLNKSLEKNPDTVTAYRPYTMNEFSVYNGSQERKADIIDLKYADDIMNKYLSFISTGGGTWSVIKTDVHNGKKIMVLKDSFGNAFVPFLLPHYEEIYVVDARFYSIGATGMNIVQFVEDKSIQEVVFVMYMEDVNWHKFMTGVENLLGSEK